MTQELRNCNGCNYQNGCGSTQWRSGDDEVFTVDVTIAHVSAEAVVRFTTDMQEGDTGWWGVQDVMVSTAVDHPSPPAPPSAPGLWAAPIKDHWPGAVGWSGTSSELSTCGTLGTMVGGYGLFGPDAYVEKTFPLATAHSAIRIRATFNKIDEWKGRRALLYVDDNPVWLSKALRNCNGCNYQNGCGSTQWRSGDDAVLKVDVTIAHVSAEAVVRFTTDMQEGDTGWWGVQDVVVSTVALS